ncbi:hypothetical protein Enr10x_33730 [Gimesia panareensis]|uniref:TIGR03067 domain-containing protein n=1 Tax=Gimesia panareensis TaxID=2527978 RepID=A0A517Q8T1_9PLAN|nr:hypothetical protein [Gimesia panareensis]QDT28034.1 hypothetical protein Enr10x_33730 [Gimesia panareensis]
MQRLLFLLVFVSLPAPLWAADPAPQEDYDVLQGKWIRQSQDSKAGPVTIEQEIMPKQIVIKITDRNGKLIYQHNVKYRLQRLEDVRLLVFSDLEVLVGQRKGLKQKTQQPCIYRLKGDRLFVTEGMVQGDSFPPLILVWWKMKPPQPDTTL